MALEGQAQLGPGALATDVLQGLIDKAPEGEEEFLGVVLFSVVSVHGVPEWSGAPLLKP